MAAAPVSGRGARAATLPAAALALLLCLPCAWGAPEQPPASGGEPKVWRALTDEERRSGAGALTAPRPPSPAVRRDGGRRAQADGAASQRLFMILVAGAAAAGLGLLVLRAIRPVGAAAGKAAPKPDDLDDQSGVEGLWRRHLRRRRE